MDNDSNDRDPYAQTKGGHSRPLWAPWRIEYIRAEKNDGCFLCDAANKRREKDAGLVVARGKASFVLLNAYPYNAGHVLVAPFEHVGDIADLSLDVYAEMMQLVVRIKSVIASEMAPDGFNIGFNIGEAAGAGVASHVHGHVVPRWYGDTNFMPVLSDTRVVPEALHRTAELLRKVWDRDYEGTAET